MHLSGKLLKNDAGEFCLKMQISPENPELYDVPLSEFLDPLLNQNIIIDVLSVTRKWEDRQ